MTGQERFRALLKGRKADRPGFWIGNPHDDTVDMYFRYFQVKSKEELACKLHDDFAWLPADLSCWRHPEKKPIFDVLGGQQRHSLGQAGVFAECEDAKDVERFAWPDAKYIDLDLLEHLIDAATLNGMGVASGTWSCFFHVVADFFGMENYFIKMYTDPDVVTAVTERVVSFYLDANQRVYDRLGAKIDTLFLGNDFGSQLDLLISPDLFKKFVLPYFKVLIDQAKRAGLCVMLHSCGAIDRVIPLLIDAGVDALHPLQAKARGMDAQNLSKYKNDILFVGGVDTQELLPFGTPLKIKDEVHRLRDLFGTGWIVSPSHEALLPNVPPENLLAMHDAAMEL